MEIVYISIGSNLGDRASNVKEAVRRLSDEPGVEVTRTSSLYETEPWGYGDQSSFINAAAELLTDLLPRELLDVLKRIEREMGRPPRTEGDGSPESRWGPRVIDLDIVFYGIRVIEEDDLLVPHPRAHLRAFVLRPLSELAPGLVHPVIGKTVRELLDGLGEEGATAARRLEET